MPAATAADRVHVSPTTTADLIVASAGAAAGPNTRNAASAARAVSQLSRPTATDRASVIIGTAATSPSAARAAAGSPTPPDHRR
jgi:hypothetical protein